MKKSNNSRVKKIFSFTIPHTGTRFMNNIFREGLDNIAFIGDLHVRQRGRKDQPLETLPCEGICHPWWQRNVLSYVTLDELSKTILFHTHHGNLNSNIIPALRNQKPDTKVISSIRNPLLIINTLIWTNYSMRGIHISNEPIEKRKERAHSVAALMENILSIPSEHIYLFPTDLIQAKPPGERFMETCGLINHCEIAVIKKIISLGKEWNVVGDTAKTKKLLEKDADKDFARYKKTIQSNNRDAIDEILGVELSCLKDHSELKDNLEKIGYSICW